LPVEKIHISEFLPLADSYPVLDVRSPAEYKHAHIPRAHSIPLFTDEERKIVGTTYKQQSREAAIKIGLDLFGPKMRRMVEEVENIVSNWQLPSRNNGNGSITADSQIPTANCILVYCWRGGMRSAGVAWLLDLYGFKVYTLKGGYKSYRNYVLSTFNQPHNFKILGGYTGSGKTVVLKELEKRGEKVVDLEALACHKGSAFGGIGEAAQPTQEMFENLLSYEFRKKTSSSTIDESTNSIWLEDESQRIGLVNIQHALWKEMRGSQVYFMDIPFEERLNYVVECYGGLEKEKMVNAIIRIGKRLGGLETKTAINFLLENNMKECFRILLTYYDKYYLKGLYNRQNGETLITKISCEKVDAPANAQSVLSCQPSLVATNFLRNE
jgi:tRNA 2-selenouridine synthase